MDYPKSVAGVGLVDGKFVDEDQVNGTPGSLIPAQWGNDVTEEILNVVREVGDVPAEATKNQLVGAIWKMFRSATAGATELLRGVLRVGTQPEVDAGALDDVAVTPKKLRAGFAISLGNTGFIALPTWLGGLVIQWGTVPEIMAGSSVVITLPLLFPNNRFNFSVTGAITGDSTSPFSLVVDPSPGGSQFTVRNRSTNNSGASYWHAIGN